MESRPKCGSIQISLLIPFKCCSFGFMLEQCHNALFYDTANLMWQLTATRQSNLPSSLPFLLALAKCACLLCCPGGGAHPTPRRDGLVEQTDKKLFLLFFGILSAPWTGLVEGQVSASAHQGQEERRSGGWRGHPLVSSAPWDPSSVPTPSCETVQKIIGTTADLQVAVL